MDGVSVVICCHNSFSRLPATLAHLNAQQVGPKIPWEVVVIDNASIDGTSAVALDNWPKEAPATLRVVNEPQLGLSHARNRGFSEAKYEIVCFVDDDNWVYPNWVQLVSEIMSQHPQMGACGGFTEAVCEITPPWWFESYKKLYAIGAQADEAGDISHEKGSLWGAGLSIRKKAWQQLVNHGFRPLLVDRQGTALSTGGDSELCHALRLAGWGLWYDPRLRIRHYLPAGRLEWLYLRKRFRGEGAASVFYDLFHYAHRGEPKTLRETLKRTWQWKTLAASIKVILYSGKSFLAVISNFEGNADILRFEAGIGRLSELLRSHKVYRLTLRKTKFIQFSRN